MVQNGPNDHFGRNGLIPNWILAFAKPKWTKMVYFGPFWPDEVHFGPFRSANRTLAIPEQDTFAERVKVRQENMTATWGSARSALSKFLACREIILLNLLWGVLLCFLITLALITKFIPRNYSKVLACCDTSVAIPRAWYNARIPGFLSKSVGEGASNLFGGRPGKSGKCLLLQSNPTLAPVLCNLGVALLRRPGDSQRELGQFARIDSQKKKKPILASA